MACFHPLVGVRGGVNANGKRPLLFDVQAVRTSSLVPEKVPCGQCVGCRLERSRQWAMRCMDEARMHEENSFITLTFSPEALVERERELCKMHGVNHGSSLCPRDFQLFMKRLRKEVDGGVRYYHCGEYGDRLGRPHYHACLFGLGFSDKKPWKLSASGETIYRSATLEKVWPHGHSSVGSVTFESAAYVARYVMKKVTGAPSTTHYLDKWTGELKHPEYTTMSRRPGIGKRWYEKFKSDCYPHGTKVVRGVECSPPRYYDGLYELDDPVGFRALKAKRNKSVDKEENTTYRLLEKEEYTEVRVKQLKRSFEEE